MYNKHTWKKIKSRIDEESRLPKFKLNKYTIFLITLDVIILAIVYLILRQYS